MAIWGKEMKPLLSNRMYMANVDCPVNRVVKFLRVVSRHFMVLTTISNKFKYADFRHVYCLICLILKVEGLWLITYELNCFWFYKNLTCWRKNNTNLPENHTCSCSIDWFFSVIISGRELVRCQSYLWGVFGTWNGGRGNQTKNA